MPNISDRRLSSLYSNWQRSSQPIGKEQALEILAHEGDSSRWSQAGLLAEMKKPGMTTERQIALAAAISANEKNDIATIVESNKVPLDPAARSFLEQVIGRRPTACRAPPGLAPPSRRSTSAPRLAAACTWTTPW